MNKIYMIKCFDKLEDRTNNYEIAFIYDNYEDAKKCIEDNTFDFKGESYLYFQLKSYVIGDYLPEYNIYNHKDSIDEIYKLNTEKRKWELFKGEINE